jgi:hypothetical protein
MFFQTYAISNEFNSRFLLIASLIFVRNHASNLLLFYSFSHEVNAIVSPWIAFALLIYQLLIVAEVFQLALVSAFLTSLLLTDSG